MSDHGSNGHGHHRVMIHILYRHILYSPKRTRSQPRHGPASRCLPAPLVNVTYADNDPNELKGTQLPSGKCSTRTKSHQQRYLETTHQSSDNNQNIKRLVVRRGRGLCAGGALKRDGDNAILVAYAQNRTVRVNRNGSVWRNDTVWTFRPLPS